MFHSQTTLLYTYSHWTSPAILSPTHIVWWFLLPITNFKQFMNKLNSTKLNAKSLDPGGFHCFLPSERTVLLTVSWCLTNYLTQEKTHPFIPRQLSLLRSLWCQTWIKFLQLTLWTHSNNKKLVNKKGDHCIEVINTLSVCFVPTQLFYV